MNDIHWYIIPTLAEVKEHFVPEYISDKENGPYFVAILKDSRIVFDKTLMSELIWYYTNSIQNNRGEQYHWLYDKDIGWLRPREKTA